jgi:hypothetical protein
MKKATQVSGHSLKLHFCMFEKLYIYMLLKCIKFWNFFSCKGDYNVHAIGSLNDVQHL